VTLRDDKTYYHLSLDPKEKFPRLQLVRKRLNSAVPLFRSLSFGTGGKRNSALRSAGVPAAFLP